MVKKLKKKKEKKRKKKKKRVVEPPHDRSGRWFGHHMTEKKIKKN
jgi:hypothetical protein